jgi:hypothetical protein
MSRSLCPQGNNSRYLFNRKLGGTKILSGPLLLPEIEPGLPVSKETLLTKISHVSGQFSTLYSDSDKLFGKEFSGIHINSTKCGFQYEHESKGNVSVNF